LRNCSRKTSGVATKEATLLNSVQKCTFLIADLVMQNTSGIILPVSKLLKERIRYQVDKLDLLAIFIISQRFAHLFKWASSGQSLPYIYCIQPRL